jgi:hypothetical protein
MKHEREFDTSYFHNPHIQGVNYSLFIMLLKEMMSMESKGQPGAALTASPLQSLQSSDLYCVFCVSLSPSHKIIEGVVYIVRYMSRRSHTVQDCVETTLEGRDGAHHAVSMWDHTVPPPLFLVASPIDFFFSRSSISQKMMWQKVWVSLTSVRPLKLKNMQKQGNLIRCVKSG